MPEDGGFLSWGWPGVAAFVWLVWTGLFLGIIESETVRRFFRLFLFGVFDWAAAMICLDYGTRALCLPGRYQRERSLAGVINIAVALVIVYVAFGPLRGG